ncbi:MAG: hypothetical protein AAGJ35_10590, partial [Myxococcota bacterium]
LHFSAYLEIVNFSKQSTEGFLELRVNGQIVETVQLNFAPGQRLRKVFPKLMANGQSLMAKISVKKGEDALDIDNVAYAVLPKMRPPSVLLVSDENLYLHAALLSDPQILYRSMKCARYRQRPQRADVVIVHGCGLGRLPVEGSFIFFDPPEKGTPFRVQRGASKLLRAPLVTGTLESHPIMAFVSLRDVNISRAVRLLPKTGDLALISSFTQPLALLRVQGQRKLLAFGFSLRETDLPWRVAFPLLMRHSIQWMVRGGRPEPPTVQRTGEMWSVPTGKRADAMEVLWRVAGKMRRLVLPTRDGHLVFTGKHVGVYTLKPSTANGVRQKYFVAANLASASESNLRPRTLTKRSKVVSAPARRLSVLSWGGWQIRLPRHLWFFLLCTALGLLCLEWWSYNRRITV